MTIPAEKKIALVTGASSGIGAATARALAADGWHVIAAARRVDRLTALADEVGDSVTAWQLDVTDQDSVDRLAKALPRLDLLVNNAGGALGMDSVAEANLDDWTRMYEINVLGTVRVTKAVLDKLLEAQNESGLVVTIGSVAGWTPYKGGSGYNAAKHGVRALTRVLRMEHSGQLRVTEIDPGRVATEEFSLVRFRGDADKAAAVYENNLNLSAEDIAEAVRWVASMPAHMNIDTMMITPRDQA